MQRCLNVTVGPPQRVVDAVGICHLDRILSEVVTCQAEIPLEGKVSPEWIWREKCMIQHRGTKAELKYEAGNRGRCKSVTAPITGVDV